jgi:hypothetical protein
MRSYAKIVKKYTDVDVTEESMFSKEASRTLRAMTTVVDKIEMLEHSLTRAASQLRDLADKIDGNVKAGPGDRIRTLNPMGELQGNDAGRVDGTIAVRDAMISQLQILAHIYREEQAEIEGPRGDLPTGTVVLVKPFKVGGRAAVRPFIGTVSAVDGEQDLLWVTDDVGREIEVSRKIVQRIDPVTVVGYND